MAALSCPAWCELGATCRKCAVDDGVVHLADLHLCTGKIQQMTLTTVQRCLVAEAFKYLACVPKTQLLCQHAVTLNTHLHFEALP